ncbi:MAG: hypothetical protein FWE88_05205 [Phycisphaerae bacterium]|nr:hypothetical protein [Phycisphaerae bacterium]
MAAPANIFQEGCPMDEMMLKKRMHELVAIVSATPQAQKVAGGAYHPELPPQESSEAAFAFLQLQLKYLVFDVEATRRENRYLRQLLENRPQPPRSTEKDDDIMPF